MNADRSATASTPRLRTRWYTGLTLKGLGLIVLLCVINAVRQTSWSFFNTQYGFVDWLIPTAQGTSSGLIVAIPVALAVVATYNLGPRGAPWRHIALALAIAIPCLLGVALQVGIDLHLGCSKSYGACFFDRVVDEFEERFVRYGLTCAFFTVVFVYLRTSAERIARAQDADHERARFVQRMAEARLRMLQAQIEPHFLFNTLANVRRLYQTAPADAARMLDNLMHYLEVALPQMRSADSTLGREAALTDAYLEIQRIRMGHRLTFEIDIPDALRDTPLPPMMLVTLAENAIKHGLAPLPEGGAVSVSASVQGNELTVQVADSGRGFTQSSGGGTGLANIRARLAALYGAAGRLTLALNTPHGVVATIAIPLSTAGSRGTV
jgi:signal transduction histidine kinase